MFFEEHPLGFEPVTRVTADSPMRFTWSDTQKRLAGALADEYFGKTIDVNIKHGRIWLHRNYCRPGF